MLRNNRNYHHSCKLSILYFGVNSKLSVKIDKILLYIQVYIIQFYLIQRIKTLVHIFFLNPYRKYNIINKYNKRYPRTKMFLH